MSKNGSITNFFKPASNVSQSPASQTSKAQASPTPPQRSPSLPDLLSSSPALPTSAVRDRNTVIKGSDDEDDDDFDSDDDFPDLFARPSASTLPAQPPRNEHNLAATPRAKRRALDFHSSPLTINTRHKFDIKALRKHAEADNAIEESEQRTAALLAQGSPTARSDAMENGARANLHDAMLTILSDPGDCHDDGNRDRLLRAVERTEANIGKKEWYFFEHQGEPNKTAIQVRPAFPKSKATGVWSFLAPDKHRSEVFEDGLPYNVQCRMQTVPDEIFEWVLNETPWEKSTKLRDEYIRFLGVCSDQIGRLVDEHAVLAMFRDLGASDRVLGSATQPGASSEQGAPYPEHGKARLEIVLRILSNMAHALKLQVLTQTTAILLRLGIDNIVREDQTIGTAYQDAMLQLVSAVSHRSWNTFCGDVSVSLYSHTQEATLRWNAVASIPLLHGRLMELRRRLALVFVFDDPRRAFSSPEDTFSIRSVIDRLDQGDEFIIDRNNTDYLELLALSEMLSVAVGDGSPPVGNSGSEAIKHYDAEVDELAHKIKHMWSNIHEQGAAYMSRLEVRVQLRDFERKLQHVVRTRPPPKEHIFDIQPTEDDLERPRQQQFMKRFLSKDLPPKTPAKPGGKQ